MVHIPNCTTQPIRLSMTACWVWCSFFLPTKVYGFVLFLFFFDFAFESLPFMQFSIIDTISLNVLLSPSSSSTQVSSFKPVKALNLFDSDILIFSWLINICLLLFSYPLLSYPLLHLCLSKQRAWLVQVYCSAEETIWHFDSIQDIKILDYGLFHHEFHHS